MAQFGRPVADVTITGWEDELGNTTNLFESVDEATPDDNDYVRSPANPSNSPVVFRLNGLIAPPAGGFGQIRVRFRKQPATASQMNIDFELREGYVSEASPGTRIGFTHGVVNIGSTFTTEQRSFQVNDVTDWNDLYLRVVANQP